MARITEDALDEVERQRLQRGPIVRRPAIRLAPAAPLAAVVLLVGGAIGVAASSPVLGPDLLLAVGAIAAGGWLARGGGDHSASDDLRRREAALARREGELNRVLVAFALRGNDVLTELARRGIQPAPAAEPRAPDGDDPEERRDRLVAYPGSAGGESLEPDADAGALG